MYYATQYDSEPQSLTIGLPGGILKGTVQDWGYLWILGSR